jgi:hypothetical protein
MLKLFGIGERVVRARILFNEVLVRCGGKDTVDPSLFVLVPGSSESGPRELFGI